MSYKSIIGLIAATTLFAACQQNSYKIVGTVESLIDGDTLFLSHDMNEGLPSDTIIVKDGKFEISGIADSTTLSMIYDPNTPQLSATFFTEPGTIEIKLAIDAAPHIGGTKANDGLQEINEMGEQFSNQMSELTRQYYDPNTSEETKQEIAEQVKQLQDELAKKIVEATEKHIGNELGFFLITNLGEDIFTPEERLELIKKMPSEFRKRQAIKDIEKEMAEAESVAIGKTIPDFSFPAPDGTPLNIMSEVSKNQLTILDFWASWCGPCCGEMPFMKQLYEKYNSKGLGIVGISLDESHEAWVTAISELGITWPQMSDLKGWNSEVGQLFKVNSIPFMVIVDQKGTILQKGLRGNDLEEFVGSQLN